MTPLASALADRGWHAAAIDNRTAVQSPSFVDAILPPADAAFRPSTRFIEFLETVLTVDGQLAPWDQWWPAGTLQGLRCRRRPVAVSPHSGCCQAFYWDASESVASDDTRGIDAGPVDMGRVQASANKNGGIEILGPPPFGDVA